MARRLGSITPFRDGRWLVRLTIAGERKSLGVFDTHEEAERILTAALDILKPEERELTLQSWGKRWFDAREEEGLTRGIDKERRVWRNHVEPASFAVLPLRRITSKHLRDWLRVLAKKKAQSVKVEDGKKTLTDRANVLSRQSLVHALRLVRSSLTGAVEENLLTVNPALGLRVPPRPRSDETWTFLTDAEIKTLLKCAKIPERHRAVYEIAIYTGLRKGELWGLQWSDVTLKGDRPELIVRHSYKGPTKSGRIRRVPLLAQARAALVRWIAIERARRVADEEKGRRPIASLLVFPREDGGCHTESYSAEWDRWKLAAGIERKVRFHDLRHTCASHLSMGTWGQSWRLEEIRDWLGHSTVTVTERYAHLGTDSIAAKARLMDSSGKQLGIQKRRKPSARRSK